MAFNIKKKKSQLAMKGIAILAAFTMAICGIPAAAFAADASQGGGSAPSSQGGGTPPDSSGGGSQPGGSGGGGGGGANTSSFDYSGSYSGTFTADGQEATSDSQSISATDASTNAVLATNAGTAKVTNATISKSGDVTDGDSCNFYGVNSVILAVGEGSIAYVSNSSISADSEGSNGIFATDSATVYSNDNTISTTAGNSRGLDATYGGTIVANETNITTQGDHCAGVATDRGGGYVSLTNSTINTAGSGSPVLYSTGDIEINNVTGTATGSQLVGMEGLNTVLISNSTLSSTITSATASDPEADGVIIYQSTSGDAETTTGEAALFQAVDSTLSSKIASGAMFYLTNTTANVVLSGTTLDFDSSAANLITAEGNNSNNWGSAGSNGATVNFTGLGETLTGNISSDTISSLDFFLLDGSTWTGAASIADNSSASSTVSDNLTVNVDSSSKWVVSGDSTVYNLNVAQGGQVVDSSGNTVKIVDGSGNTLVDGNSSVTITVKGAYSTTVTTSDVNAVQSASISRTAFDSYYGTSTEFSTSSSGSTSSALASAINKDVVLVVSSVENKTSQLA